MRHTQAMDNTLNPTTPHPSEARADYDSPWKEAIEQYFQDFLAFFFPRIHADIAWDRGYTFLDTELERVVRDATLGRRYADRLVKVFLRDGSETWLLIHLEIQSYPDPELPKRLYIYNYRIFDRYDVEVVTLLLLTTDLPATHTQPYRRSRWGCHLTFRFPTVRISTRGRHPAALERSRNPFAVVVRAHQLAQALPPGEARQAAKFQLIRQLYQRGVSRTDVLNLFRFIDWLLVLPPDLERRLRDELRTLEETYQMPYVTHIERLGREEGFAEGLEQGSLREARQMLLEALVARFGTPLPEDIERTITAITQRDTLHRLLRQAIVAPTLAAVQEALHQV